MTFRTDSVCLNPFEPDSTARLIRNHSSAQACFFTRQGSATAFGGLGGNFGLNFKTNSLRLRGGSTTQMNAMPKLTYFDAKGVAETARIMFKAAGAEFEDERFKVEPGPPPKAPEFDAAKESGRCVSNMDRAPLMSVGDVTFGQSHSINRYVAQQNGFMGSDMLSAACIDCLYEHVRDIKDAFSKVRFMKGTDEEKKEAMDKFLAEDLPSWINKLDKAMAAMTPSEGDFAYGDKLSLADFAIYTWIESIETNQAIMDLPSPPWEKSSRITKVYQSVKNHPSVKKWLEERPVTFM